MKFEIEIPDEALPSVVEVLRRNTPYFIDEQGPLPEIARAVKAGYEKAVEADAKRQQEIVDAKH